MAPSVQPMSLDVYRSCTRVEKRDVLHFFWRRQVDAPDRVRQAALQYGPWAVLCCAILALEPIPVLVLSIGRVPALVVVAVVIEVVIVASLWWATVRVVALRRQSTG
jgi:hypothetical protein